MPERRLHDYRQRYWGHDFTIRPDQDPATAHITGWGYGVGKDDLLIVPNGEGACFYRIEKISRPGDPEDMWSADVRFVQASSELVQLAIAALEKPRDHSPISLTSWVVLDA